MGFQLDIHFTRLFEGVADLRTKELVHESASIISATVLACLTLSSISSKFSALDHPCQDRNDSNTRSLRSSAEITNGSPAANSSTRIRRLRNRFQPPNGPTPPTIRAPAIFCVNPDRDTTRSP